MTSPQGQLPRLLPFELHQFEKSPSTMYIVDRETLRCLAVNDAALRLYGYTSEEFLGLTLSETRHPDDDPVNHAGGGALVRHCGLRRHVKRSGEVFLADVVVQGVLFEERHASLVLLLDTPERMRAHSQRLPRDSLFKALADHSPDVIARIDRQLRHVYVNPAVVAATGITPEQLLAGNERELGVPLELCVQWAAGARRVFATGRQHEIDISFPTPDGERYYSCHMMPEVGPNGRVKTVLAIARDISDRKRAELALRETETRLRQTQDEFAVLADALPQSIACYDRQLRHTYANAAMERATGRARADLIGRTDTDLGFSPAQAEVWTRSLRRVLETGEISTFEFDVPGALGARRYEAQHIPLMRNGGVEGVIGVSYDITERARAEDDRLSQLSTQHDALIGEVHHRVKNSLQGVVGLLRQLASVHGEVAPILDKAVSQLRAMEIAHGLQGRESRDGVLLEGLVTEIAKSAETTTGVQVSCMLDAAGIGQELLREQDAVAVALVMQELIMNACKHGSGGIRGALVKVRVSGDAGRACVAVTNPGSLPDNFDFTRGRNLGSGLELVKVLLPPDGAQLAYSVDPWSVTAALHLEPPVLSRGAPSREGASE